MGQSFYDLLKDAAFAGGGGGSPAPAPVLIEKSVTENGTYTASDDEADGYSAVTVNVSGGSSTAAQNDVNFYDYDGTIVNSYSAAEFANLAAMPENPTHDGLTAQGWNWSLSDAKTYVEKYGKLNIGQMYITSDGKTRLYITLSEGRTSPILKLHLDSNSEIDVDWGDGTEHETLTSTSAGNVSSNRHEYASSGDYVIAITVVSGEFSFVQYLLSNGGNSDSSPDRAYLNSVKACEIGNGVKRIEQQAFYNCFSLSSITIPNSVTSIEQQAFGSCSSLSSITIPNSVTTIGTSAFSYCSSLSSVIIPNSVTSIGSSAFINGYSLSSVTIPDSVTSLGTSAFSYCSSLSSVIIPSSVTSIENNLFSDCSSLSSITIPNSVTTISSSMFRSCASLSSITIPDSVTSIGLYAFDRCPSLSSVIIPSSVTSIEQQAFQYCYALPSITIPNSVTSIGVGTFQTCYSLSSITINKSEGSITGSPWGAPANTQIIWRKERYKSSVTEIASGTTLTGAVDATADDLVVATFVIRGNTYTISEGWTLLGISNPVGTFNQRTAMAYKIASSSSESLTVTQDTSARIYINLVSITGASVGSFSGFTTQEEGTTITMNKPQGLVIWGVSSSLWGTASPYLLWGVSPVSDNRASIQLPNTTQPRCLTVLDQSNDETVSFRYGIAGTGNGALAAASLTITGIPNFWYLE